MNQEIAAVWKEELQLLFREAMALRQRNVEDFGMVQKKLRISIRNQLGESSDKLRELSNIAMPHGLTNENITDADWQVAKVAMTDFISQLIRSCDKPRNLSSMEHSLKVDKLKSLMSCAANDLPFQDFVKLENLQGLARQAIKRIFPANRDYLKELENIKFTLGVYHSGTTPQQEKKAWEDGRQTFVNLCTRLISELNLDLQEEARTADVPWVEGKDPHKDKLKYMQWLLERAQALSVADDDIFRDVKQKTEMVIRKFFGEHSHYLITVRNIHFSDGDGLIDEDSWDDAKQRIVGLIETMIDDLSLPDEPAPLKKNYKVVISGAAQSEADPHSKKVFVVHGHDDAMKGSVARVLEKLGLEPIILHEKPDQGKTVIEKFMANSSDVGFAVVLLSGDDIAYPKSAKPKQARPRARQNVILELGFFVGKLGREKVLPLYRKADNFEHPSDFAGVLYKEFDEHGHWRFELVKELQAEGYDVDANKLM